VLLIAMQTLEDVGKLAIEILVKREYPYCAYSILIRGTVSLSLPS